jgi:transcriptional regulator with XRE-family HTH domain
MPSRPEHSHSHRQSNDFVDAVGMLARRVRQLRMSRRWTLEVAAEQMGLDIKHLQKVEAGTVNVTLVTLSRIAKGLGVGVGDLFEPAPKPPPKPPAPNPVPAPATGDRLQALGRRVGHLRRQRGLTQTELAERVGVAPSLITRLENGRSRRCPVSVVLDIADELGVGADALVGPGQVEPHRPGRPTKR